MITKEERERGKAICEAATKGRWRRWAEAAQFLYDAARRAGKDASYAEALRVLRGEL